MGFMTTGLPEKENEELLRELRELRQQVAELQAVDAKRGQAEEALRQSEERYRLVMEGIEDAYWELDLAGNTTFFNDCAARIHDCSPADLMGRNYRDYMEEKAAREITEKFIEIYRTGNPATGLVWEVVRKDGSKRILESNISLIRDAAGKGSGFRGISRDVTERRQAEENLRQRKERYRTIIEEMPDNYWEVDLNGRFTFINEQLIKMQGRSKEELIGLDTLQFLDAASLKNLRRQLKEVHRTGEAQRGIPYQITRKNGEILDMEANVSLMRDGAGNPIGFRGVSRNVTERKQIEAALRQSEERFRLLAQATNDAVWDWDLLTDSLWRNEGFETLFGYRREELEPGIDSSYNRIHPEDRERVAAGLQAVIHNDKSIWSDEYRFRRAEGSYAFILDRAYVIRDEQGKPVRMIGAMLDLSSLKQVEEQFRMVVESSPNGIVMTDQGGNILFINAEIERLFGYGREELVGQSIDILAPDNFREMHKQLREGYLQAPQRRGMRGGKNFSGRCKDGREFPAEIGLNPIQTPEGLRILGVVTDITERKQAEDALRQSEERYRTIIESMPDNYWEGDLNGRLTYINQQVLRLHQRTREELMTLSGEQYMSEETLKRLRAAFRQIYNSGEPVTAIPYTIIRRDGTTRDVEANISLIKNQAGQPIGFRGISRDVTERKQAEEALRQSEERYRTVIEEMTDSFWETDLTGRFTFFNHQVVIEQKRSPEELLNSSEMPYLDGENRRLFADLLKVIYATGKPVRGFNNEMIRGDGTRYTIESSISLIRDRDGTPSGFRGISRDVTRRVEAEKKLQQAKDAAETASRTKSEFLANMSHEIRTPMNGIIGMTELALDTQLSSEQREYLNLVKTSADALLSVINDILDFSKIEAGKLELDPVQFNLRDQVEETMKTLALRAHEKGLELACHILPEVPDGLMGDVGRLRQILINLVGNAIKFTSRGEVVVHVAVEAVDPSTVRLSFKVADTGIGIAPEKQAVIFDAFSQADGSTTRRYGGTGLGLTISSKLVEMMGGQIGVESQVDVGSVFHFTLPFVIDLGTATPKVALREVNWHNLPVLIVDDNATNRYILEEMLSNWQMAPTAVSGAKEALLKLERLPGHQPSFPLVLLDAQMPEMDGFSLAEAINRNPDFDGATIMMLSSAGQAGDAARCRELGIAAYLTKPVKQSELFNAILGVLGAPTVLLDQKKKMPAIKRQDQNSGRCILLAEDHVVNQRLAIRLLEKEGYCVVVAADGRQAIEAYERQPFDLILMDIQMPEINGYEATAAIREKEKVTGTHIPIIAMTAHAMKGDRERCLEAGMDGYVSKPIKPKDLFKTMKEFIVMQNKFEAPPGVKETADKLLDREVAMTIVDGDVEMLAELVILFLEECPAMEDRIRETIALQNSQGLERAAHTLKGAIANFGAQSVCAAAQKLETLGRENNFVEAEAAYRTLTAELERVKPALSQLCESVVC